MQGESVTDCIPDNYIALNRLRLCHDIRLSFFTVKEKCCSEREAGCYQKKTALSRLKRKKAGSRGLWIQR